MAGNRWHLSRCLCLFLVLLKKDLEIEHSINLTAFGSPTYRASNSPNTQEAYDIMGKNYNSYWGWQDGEKKEILELEMFSNQYFN